MNNRDVDWLLGRRFQTDFTVLAVGDDPERTVIVSLYGDHYAVSLEELQTIIDRGLVVEAPPSPPGRES